jgi:signal transduction histidine kinase
MQTGTSSSWRDRAAWAFAWCHWLVPPTIRQRGGDDERRALLVVYASVLGTVGLLWFSIAPEHAALPQVVAVARWYWIAHVAVLLSMRITNSVALGANLAVACSAVYIGYFAAATGGRDTGSLFGTVILPLCAILLCGRRAGVAWGAAIVAVLAAIDVLTERGFQFPIAVGQAEFEEARVRAAINLVVIATLIAYLYETLRERALVQLAAAKALAGQEAERKHWLASLVLHGIANDEAKPTVDRAVVFVASTLDLAAVEVVAREHGEVVVHASTGGETGLEALASVRAQFAAWAADETADRFVFDDLATRGRLVVPIQGRDDTRGAILGVARTERRFREDEREFAEAVGTLIGLLWERDAAKREAAFANTQLAEARRLESIGQLSAGIAHEINTPCQFAVDNVEFLKETFPELMQALDGDTSVDLEFLRKEIPAAIEQTREGIQRVSKIVLAMREFSHPGSADKAAVDVNRAIESTITVARNEWKYVAEVSTDLDPELPRVPCYGGPLNQAILNMIVNAAHAIAAGRRDDDAKGEIRVSTRRRGDVAVIEIADTGTGIPEAIRHKIFDPFFTTKEVGKGTGQGLAIAHSVVVGKHGGTLEVESEEGRGTTFRITLPLDASARG